MSMGWRLHPFEAWAGTWMNPIFQTLYLAVRREKAGFMRVLVVRGGINLGQFAELPAQ